LIELNSQRLSVSIVSHRQAVLIESLLGDLNRVCSGRDIEVILTLNLPEELPFNADRYTFQVKLISNPAPLGFGANHNQAFQCATGAYFCVLNPDIALQEDPFTHLLPLLVQSQMGLVAPVVVDGKGILEDSARYFPTPWEIAGKFFGGQSRVYREQKGAIGSPDWVAGMFMLFRHDVYEEIGGFDAKRYFMYYEDVDICFRLRQRQYEIALSRDAIVIHHARRSSHHNLRYLTWHVSSMLKFFLIYYRCKIWPS